MSEVQEERASVAVDIVQDQADAQNRNEVPGTELTAAPVPATLAPEPSKKTVAEKYAEERKRVIDVAPASGSVIPRVFRLARREFFLIIIGTYGFIAGFDCKFTKSGCIAACGEGLMPVVFYWLFGDLVGVLADPTGSAFTAQLNRIASLMAGIAGIAAVCGFTKEFMLNTAAARIGVKVKGRLLRSVVNQEIGFFDATKSGTLLSLLSEDVQVLEQGYGPDLGRFWQFITQFIVGIVLAFTRSWQMSLVILAVAPVLAVGLGVQSRVTDTFTRQSSEASSRAVSAAEEIVTSMRTIRSFATESREAERFNSHLSDVAGLAQRKAVLTGFSYGLVLFCLWGAAALAFWYGGTLVNQGILRVNDVVTVFGLMLIAVLGLGQAMAQVQSFIKASGAGSLLFAVIERQPKVPLEGGMPVTTVEGAVAFDDVHFTYPTRDQEVLHGVSFAIRPGEKVAFVGGSGSGKSTVFQLLQRFYEPQAGVVLVDGHNIQEYDPKMLRRTMATVSQEPTLFAGSIEENIRYGRLDATDEEVHDAAVLANVHKDIMSFKDQYKTQLGEKGVTLSGGQKQRVAIARAVLTNPRILLLDEATSALDTESEKLVQESLETMMQGRTALVIAHRLTTIMDANRIYVMENGSIVQEGTHESLLADKEGAYYKLASRQMLGAHIDDKEVGQQQHLGQTPTAAAGVMDAATRAAVAAVTNGVLTKDLRV